MSQVAYGFLRSVLGGLTALMLAACSPAELAAYEPTFADKPARVIAETEILFAVHPLHNPTRLFHVYQPLVDLINEQVGPTYRVKLETSRDYAAFEAKLADKKFHVAVPNPYQTLTSEAHGYRIMGKMSSDRRFRGIIVVRRDSNIASLADLKGAPISFPAPTALAATMMPRMFLYEHGLGAADINARYVGSQESAIMNVLLGKTVAGGTWPPPWEALLRRRPELAEQLEVKWETEPLINNGLVVREGVPRELADGLATVVFHLHEHQRGKAILEAMEIDRFEPADRSTFEPVRRFIRDYEAAFGSVP